VIDDSVKTYEYDSELFGEGLCPRNKDEFVILTWKEGKIIASATFLSAANALSLQAFLMAATPYSGLDQDISDIDLWKYF
jgi:hypothetical protein